jgi:coenzyme PQQ precursor peptide PqqA
MSLHLVHPSKEAFMSWITPSFEIIELSSEVTCYRYHR